MKQLPTETGRRASPDRRALADPIRALLVEDDADASRLAIRRLESYPDADFQVSPASTLADALALLEEETFDVMILDVGLPDVEGLVTVAHASLISRHLPIVVLTGNSSASLCTEALRAGCQDYLVKEVQDGERLGRSVAHAVARSGRRRREPSTPG